MSNTKKVGKSKLGEDGEGGDNNTIGMLPCGDPQQKKIFCFACYSHPGVIDGDVYTVGSFSKHKVYHGDENKLIKSFKGSTLCLASIPLEDLMRSNKHSRVWFTKMFGPDYLDKSEEIHEWSKIHDPRFDIWPDLTWTHRDEDWEEKRKEATVAKKKKDKRESVRNIFPNFTDDEVEDWMKKNLPGDDTSEGDASPAAKDDDSVSDTEDVAKAAADDDTFEGDASPAAKNNASISGTEDVAEAAAGDTMNAGMMTTLGGNTPLQRFHASQQAAAPANLRMHPFILTGYQTAGGNMAGGRFPPQAFVPGAFMGRAANMPQLGSQIDNERVATQLTAMGRPNPVDAIAAAQAQAAQAQAYHAAQAQVMGIGMPPAANMGNDADILAAIQQRQRYLSRLEADFKAKMAPRGGNGGGM